jgi:hypothetical protein
MVAVSRLEERKKPHKGGWSGLDFGKGKQALSGPGNIAALREPM